MIELSEKKIGSLTGDTSFALSFNEPMLSAKTENRQLILNNLLLTLRYTRSGKDILGLFYVVREGNEEFVMIHFPNGNKEMCVTADSGIAMISDVLKALR